MRRKRVEAHNPETRLAWRGAANLQVKFPSDSEENSLKY